MRVLRDLGRSVCGDMHARVERGHSGAQVKSEVAEGTAKGYKPIPADAHEHWCAACMKVKARASAVQRHCVQAEKARSSARNATVLVNEWVLTRCGLSRVRDCAFA